MSKKDNRHKIIGGRHRAASRFAMIQYRIRNTSQSKNSGYAGVEIRIERECFIKWFMANDFPGCSVDRIDSRGHYELGNLQLITLAENIRKDKLISANGVCRCYSCKKEKPLNEFAVSKVRSTGHTTICKQCDSSRVKVRSAETIAHHKELCREYYINVTKPKAQAASAHHQQEVT